MKQISFKTIVAVIICLASLGPSGCGGDSGSPGIEYDPSLIVATWQNSATGDPTDRTNTDPADWVGTLCETSDIGLTNYNPSFNGLTITNHCSYQITYYICAISGSIVPIKEGGSSICSEDIFRTPIAELQVMTLNPGDYGDVFPSTRDLSIAMFYCTNDEYLNIIHLPYMCLQW